MPNYGIFRNTFRVGDCKTLNSYTDELKRVTDLFFLLLNAPDYFISDKYKVKVKTVDENGKSIYKLKKMSFYMCFQMVNDIFSLIIIIR